MIGAAHRYRRKILVASTSEIYGKNGADEAVGDRRPDPGLHVHVTRWSYSTAKAVDEILAFSYHRERGLEAVIVRLFNTVGPRQSPAYGMVIPRLVRQARAAASRSPCPRRRRSDPLLLPRHDVVEALVGLLDEPAAIGNVFNVGGSFGRSRCSTSPTA